MKSPHEIANEYAKRMGWPRDGEGALCIEAAIMAAIEQDVRLNDERLFLSVDFVNDMRAAYEGALAGIRAAVNGDLHPDVSTETLVRNLYHENVSLRFAARGLAAKVKAGEAQEL